MFQGTKTRSIFHLFWCAPLEAALKRTKTLPRRSWDAPRSLQDAPGCLLDAVWGGNLGATWGLLRPSWAPRRDQDLPKSRPKHLPRRTWQPEPPRHPKSQKESKMKPRTPQNRAPNLGKLQNRAETLKENFENPAQTLLENRAPNPRKSNPNGAVNF